MILLATIGLHYSVVKAMTTKKLQKAFATNDAAMLPVICATFSSAQVRVTQHCRKRAG